MSVKDKDIIFFDGLCTLCHGAVQFIIKRDPKSTFQFCSLQSEKTTQLLGDHLSIDSTLNSIVLLREDQVYTESAAALRICQKLQHLWPLLSICLVIPPFIRNALYRCIAGNRYRWFEKLEQCPLPDPAQQDRFLD